MSDSVYFETGGIRYGNSYWSSSNFSWPFASLKASPEEISICVSFSSLWTRTFTFNRSQIKSIRKKRGLWSVGIEIDHSATEIPPFILFWTFHYKTLKKHLESLGYDLVEKFG